MTDRLERPKNDALIAVAARRTLYFLRSLGYRMPLYRLRLKGRHPLKLLASPADLWPGNAEKGAALLAGTFTHAGKSHTLDKGDIWLKAEREQEAYARWLQSFCWLRHLAAAPDGKAAQRQAEHLVKKWLEHYHEWHPLAWRPEIIGERLGIWLFYAPLILSSPDMVYRSAVLNAMARQARHLTRTVMDIPDGPARIASLVGLALTGLLLPNAEGRLSKALKRLEKALTSYILPDGGPASRNPAHGLAVLKNLLMLRRAFEERKSEEPPWLQTFMDRIVPFLKALTHPDGGFAAFNGAFPDDAKMLAAAIAKSGATGRAIENASYCGYRRFERNGAVLILDAGPPPKKELSEGAHASALSFEFSKDGQRMIVNVGGSDPDAAPGRNDLSFLNRTSAAHSTLILASTNSAEVLADGTLGHGPTVTICERNENDGGAWIEAEHDGYAGKFGLRHQRRLFLSSDGCDFRGEDRLIPGGKKPFSLFGRQKTRAVHIRFHIHPDVACSATQDGSGIILKLASKQGWLFRAKGGEIGLEDSLYLSAAGQVRKSSQIIIAAAVQHEETLINWSFRHMERKS